MTVLEKATELYKQSVDSGRKISKLVMSNRAYNDMLQEVPQNQRDLVLKQLTFGSKVKVGVNYAATDYMRFE